MWQWEHQSRMRTGLAQYHARRLKPSSLAGEDKTGGHARRLKPSSLADEDRTWDHAERLKAAPLAWEGR